MQRPSCASPGTAPHPSRPLQPPKAAPGVARTLGMACRRLLAGLGLIFLAQVATAAVLPFDYTLDNRYQTSAGVYDASGQLIRTLWSNRTREAGPHQGEWDGRDDEGRPWQGAGPVQVRVLAHNVSYRWEGVIGNSARDPLSPTKHDYQYFMRDLVVSGERVYTLQESEGWIPRVRFHQTADLNADWAPLPGLVNLRGGFNYINHLATDGERVYAARQGFDREDASGAMHAAFIVVLDPDLSRELPLAASRPTCTTAGRTPFQGIGDCYNDGRTAAAFQSAIDIVDVHRGKAVRQNDVTGLAVQPGARGRLLFAAHGGLDALHVLDKRTGQRLQVLALPGVANLAVCRSQTQAGATTELWAIHRGAAGQAVVSRFAVDSQRGQVAAQPGLTLSEPMTPLALALSPNCGELAVIAGGERQQVLGFDPRTGVQRWALGEAGGYRSNGPEVRPQRFSFIDRMDEARGQVSEFGLLDYAPNGDLFVGDPGLTRVQRFDAARRVVDLALWAPLHYNIRVDQNDPSRVFRGFHEYAMQYGEPIARAWRLVRYYGDSLPTGEGRLSQGRVDSGFNSLITLPDGRTLGLAPDAAGLQLAVLEVPKDGPLRPAGPRLPRFQFLRADGTLESVRYGRVGEHFVEFTDRRFEGLDARGDARWARATVEARVARGANDPRVLPYFGIARINATFESGLRLLFDPQPTGRRSFHLAAAAPGGNQWRWRASPEEGGFDLAEPDGRFDASQPWYAAMAVSTLGRHAVYNYHGEAWTSDIHGGGSPGQANQFLHFDESGLFLGQFGTPNQMDIPPSTAGVAGNSFSLQLVRANEALYLLHNSENAHAGIHLWRLDGVDHLRWFSGSGSPGGGRLRLAAEAATAAPTAAAAVAIPRPAGLTAHLAGGRVLLTWQPAPGGVTATEVERLATTFTGQRFQTVASLPVGQTRWSDSQPELGHPVVYRLRYRQGNARGDYSQHVRLSLPFQRQVVYAEDFEGQAWRQPGGQLPHWTCVGQQPGSGFCGPVGQPGQNQAFRVAVVTSEPGLRLSRGWLAQPLLPVLNRALARRRGAAPEQFEVSFDFWMSPLPATGRLRGRVEIEPGGGMHTFARLGGLFWLSPVGEFDAASGLVRGRARQVLTVLPNGRPDHGVTHFLSNDAPRLHVQVGFQGEGLSPGLPLEIRVDNLQVTRLVPLP